MRSVRAQMLGEGDLQDLATDQISEHRVTLPVLSRCALNQSRTGQDIDVVGVHWLVAVAASEIDLGDVATRVMSIDDRGAGLAGHPAVTNRAMTRSRSQSLDPSG